MYVNNRDLKTIILFLFYWVYWNYILVSNTYTDQQLLQLSVVLVAQLEAEIFPVIYIYDGSEPHCDERLDEAELWRNCGFIL